MRTAGRVRRRSWEEEAQALFRSRICRLRRAQRLAGRIHLDQHVILKIRGEGYCVLLTNQNATVRSH